MTRCDSLWEIQYGKKDIVIIIDRCINLMDSESGGGSGRGGGAEPADESLPLSVTEWCHACQRRFIMSSSKACQACR